MMCARAIPVDLPEDGRRMSNDTRLPAKEPALIFHAAGMVAYMLKPACVQPTGVNGPSNEHQVSDI